MAALQIRLRGFRQINSYFRSLFQIVSHVLIINIPIYIFFEQLKYILYSHFQV